MILRREVASRGRLLFERVVGGHRDLVADAIRVYVDYEPPLRKLGAAAQERARSQPVLLHQPHLRLGQRDISPIARQLHKCDRTLANRAS